MDENTGISKQSLYCLARHFKELVEKAFNELPPDLAKPCKECEHLQTCRADWHRMMRELSACTEVRIDFFRYT